MKKFLKENLIWIVVLMTFVITCTIIIAPIIWYHSLSSEEQAAHDLRIQELYEKNTYTYEVLSVKSYIKTNTNQFGGITSSELCYAFTYTDGINLYTEDSFQDFLNGDTSITIGNKNQYIVTPDSKILYLTKETLKGIQ